MTFLSKLPTSKISLCLLTHTALSTLENWSVLKLHTEQELSVNLFASNLYNLHHIVMFLTRSETCRRPGLKVDVIVSYSTHPKQLIQELVVTPLLFSCNYKCMDVGTNM